jgi:hypothetical protein
MSDVTSEDASKQKAGKNYVGCASVALLGAVLIGVSVIIMNRWDTLGGFMRTTAIGLAVVGTLMVLPLLIWLVMMVVLKVLFRRMGKELSAAAEKIGSDTKAMYGQLHEFTPATSEDFANVDVVFYDRTREALEAQGFQYLGDTLDRTIAKLGNPSPPIRALLRPMARRLSVRTMCRSTSRRRKSMVPSAISTTSPANSVMAHSLQHRTRPSWT